MALGAQKTGAQKLNLFNNRAPLREKRRQSPPKGEKPRKLTVERDSASCRIFRWGGRPFSIRRTAPPPRPPKVWAPGEKLSPSEKPLFFCQQIQMVLCFQKPPGKHKAQMLLKALLAACKILADVL
jgi:hypothetical protein